MVHSSRPRDPKSLIKYPIKRFDCGWMMKEIRFKKDGKTSKSINFRMGCRLYKYLNQQSRRKGIVVSLYNIELMHI